MKAWKVSDRDCEYSTVVFAENRNKARVVAQATDCCEYMNYIEIHPIRYKEADFLYKGDKEIDWNNMEVRAFLVNDGWGCVEKTPYMCRVCSLYDFCSKRINLFHE